MSTTESQKCYSTDDEEFNYSDPQEVFEGLDGLGELTAGRVYYEADCHTPSTDNVLDVDSLLENADKQLYYQIGEVYDSNAFSEASPDARAELQALLNAWAAKHISLSGYLVIDGKSRELRVTEDDVKEHTT
jgi:hypothetical protein